MPKWMTLFVGLIGFAHLAFAEGGEALLSVADAHIRATPPNATLAAAYMKLRNYTKQPMVLAKASSPVAKAVEFHNSVTKDGMTTMRRIKKVRVPAGGEAVFRPGGKHIMLIGLKRALAAGEIVPITLRFADGTRLRIQTKVRDLRDDMEQMEHDH